jgi:hypothetical protein
MGRDAWAVLSVVDPYRGRSHARIPHRPRDGSKQHQHELRRDKRSPERPGHGDGYERPGEVGRRRSAGATLERSAEPAAAAAGAGA